MNKQKHCQDHKKMFCSIKFASGWVLFSTRLLLVRHPKVTFSWKLCQRMWRNFFFLIFHMMTFDLNENVTTATQKRHAWILENFFCCDIKRWSRCFMCQFVLCHGSAHSSSTYLSCFWFRGKFGFEIEWDLWI